MTGKTYPTTYEVDYVQPFGTAPTFEYVSDTVRLVPTGGSFGWFFGRSRAFVDEQIARFPESGAPAAPANPPPARTQPASTTTQSGSAGCTLVELYPGYPGYRGNVTGVMPHWNGLGDWECLEVLERQDPAFDQAYEDRANQQAADAVGINGPKELWTWENLLMIEAKRGLQPSCYTCLMRNSEVAPICTDVEVQPDDPRVTIGFPGTDQALRALSGSLGLGAYSTASVSDMFVNDDYVLRAMRTSSVVPASTL